MKQWLNDLIDICKSQLDSFYATLDKNLIATRQDGWFAFIDWCPGLEIMTSLQGVYLYTLERFADLLKAIGDDDFEKYNSILLKVRSACRKYLYDENKKAFINSLDNNQLSVHSQIWMILGGVIDGDAKKE